MQPPSQGGPGGPQSLFQQQFYRQQLQNQQQNQQNHSTTGGMGGNNNNNPSGGSSGVPGGFQGATANQFNFLQSAVQNPGTAMNMNMNMSHRPQFGIMQPQSSHGGMGLNTNSGNNTSSANLGVSSNNMPQSSSSSVNNFTANWGGMQSQGTGAVTGVANISTGTGNNLSCPPASNSMMDLNNNSNSANARLMAMAAVGMQMPFQNFAQFQQQTNNNSAASSTALQNMQAMFLQQQRQQQQPGKSGPQPSNTVMPSSSSVGSTQQHKSSGPANQGMSTNQGMPAAANQGMPSASQGMSLANQGMPSTNQGMSSAISGLSANFNAAQQALNSNTSTSSGGNAKPQSMHLQSSSSAMNSNANTGDGSNNPRSGGGHQQHQLMLQQQLAALQKQQRSGRSSGGSIAANAAMSSIQGSDQANSTGNMGQSSSSAQGGQNGNNTSTTSANPTNNGSTTGMQMGSQQQFPMLQQGLSAQHQLLQARQQQLLQQMQRSNMGGNNAGMLQQMQQQMATNMMSVMQQQQQMQQNPSSMQQTNQQGSMQQIHQGGNNSSADGGAGGSNNNNNMSGSGNNSNHNNSNNNNSSSPNPMAVMPSFPQQQTTMMGQQGLTGMMGNNNNNHQSGDNNSVGSSKQQQNHQMLFGAGPGSTHSSTNNLIDSSMHHSQHSGSNVGAASSDQQSRQHNPFLDGRFAGGWQSNSDLPDRRQVIFNILEVIQQMRPDTSKLSNKLPHMAKSLEEHLYRSAKSKEDYMDLSTLKKRLQAIAHGLEIHRSNDPNSPLKLFGPLTSSPQVNAVNDSSSQTSNWPGSQSNSNGPGFGGSGIQIGTNMGMLSQQQQMQSDTSHSPHIGSLSQQGSVTNLPNQQQQKSGSPASFGAHQQQAMQRNDMWPSNSQSGLPDHSLMSQAAVQGSQQSNSNAMQFDQSNFASQMQMHNNSEQPHNSTNAMGALQQQGSVTSQSSQFGVTGSDIPSPAPQMGQQSSSPWPQAGNFGQQLNQGGVQNSVSGSNQDPMAAQKQRVILQQQQRLLLLRHASKCTAGKACTTKFCEQMITLWKHMKTCRNKNCKTPHCLSSRCVLNHYRICKSNGRTSSCEVCGPVMSKIKQQERDDGTTDDPLTRDQDQPIGETQQPQQQPGSMNSVTQVVSSNQQGQMFGDRSQLQQAQAQQSKLKAQLDSLKILQRQQEQLLEQQKKLEEQAQLITDPNSAQATKLQQQQLLLQQLQKRCQQQQLLVQQELQMQTSASPASDAAAGQQQPPVANQQVADTQPERNVAESTKPKTQGVARRRGSGKGKRFNKSLNLSERTKSEDSTASKKRRGSTKVERNAKKAKSVAAKSIASTTQSSAASSTKETKKKAAEVGPAPVQVEKDSTSLISCMRKEEIQKHLESLNKRIILSSRTVTHKCRPVLQELLDHQFAWVFRDAVDPVALGLPDYFDVIKNPMHLELVKKKLENAIYSDMEAFARDTKLVFENAILYNGESSEVGELAQTLLSLFEKSYNAVVQDIESSHLNLESQGELCSLCGVQKRRFEPTVLYCQGRCGMQRIKRNATYFTDRTKQNHWCSPCYELLKPEEQILLDDGTKTFKNELQEFKNDALPEEGWVNCDVCHSWVHQICSLFNGRTNKSNAPFICPTCFVKQPFSEDFRQRCQKNVKGAKELARCKMSDAIEDGLNDALQSAYASRASELGVNIGSVEKAEELCVRVLSNVDKKHFVGEKLLQRYADQGCPAEFPVRTKCIALFQKIHGVDTLLFAMYVYEYGHDCPAPNKRRVYISYLDSVQYFEPKCYRTIAYHSIIIEYLRYVKKRGFHTAHIWSCPPTPGDDYIFYCHPKHQLVPKEDMLRKWYHKMLDQAKAQGVVIRTTTLYDEYFTNDTPDPVPCQRHNPTCLPYFEGDYIPGEIENIIQHLEEEEKCGRSKPGAQGKDGVMFRIGHNLKKMKDNFIVVHLRNRRFAAAVERGEDVSQWKEDSDDDMVRSKRAKISGKNTGGTSLSVLRDEAQVDSFESTPYSAKSSSELQSKTDVKLEAAEIGRSNDIAGGGTLDERTKLPKVGKSSDDATKFNIKSGGMDANTESGSLAFKRGLDEIKPALTKHFSEVNRSLSPVADTTDEDAPLESEMFESRQQFLNYCQTTHCQFDELRRAKHSTIMVLFQLHNPSAPKFLQQCGACYRDITHGIRYHCKNCSNFDLCDECYEPVTSGLWAKRDARFAHNKTHTFTPVDMELSEETQKSRAERQQSLKAHIELLEHAGTCSGPPDCSLHNCQRLKKLFLHVPNCDVRPKKDCKVCTRLLSLCTMHARMCAARGSCPIPFCDRIRERNKRLRRQQQLMDDRRRQAQNELYRAGDE